MPGERDDLQSHIAQSVKTDPHRQEMNTMRKTIADVLKEEGRNEERLNSRRAVLLRLIRVRFGAPPGEVVATIDACADVAQLDAWLDAVGTARRLRDVGIVPPG